MSKSSRLPGFHKLPIEDRIKLLKDFADLSDEDIEVLKKTGALSLDLAERMIENVVGTLELPLGIAANFLINSRDYLIPMAIEEPSVVAAASNAAKMCRAGGGLFAKATESLMISQIQLVKVPSPRTAAYKILERKQEIIPVQVLPVERIPFVKSLPAID